MKCEVGRVKAEDRNQRPHLHPRLKESARPPRSRSAVAGPEIHSHGRSIIDAAVEVTLVLQYVFQNQSNLRGAKI